MARTRPGHGGRSESAGRICATHQADTALAGHAQTWAGDDPTVGLVSASGPHQQRSGADRPRHRKDRSPTETTQEPQFLVPTHSIPAPPRRRPHPGGPTPPAPPCRPQPRRFRSPPGAVCRRGPVPSVPFGGLTSEMVGWRPGIPYANPPHPGRQPTKSPSRQVARPLGASCRTPDQATRRPVRRTCPLGLERPDVGLPGALTDDLPQPASHHTTGWRAAAQPRAHRCPEQSARLPRRPTQLNHDHRVHQFKARKHHPHIKQKSQPDIPSGCGFSVGTPGEPSNRGDIRSTCAGGGCVTRARRRQPAGPGEAGFPQVDGWSQRSVGGGV